MAEKWIQKAKPKKGALSKQLGISEKKNIPSTLLKKIKRTEPGTTIKNPTKTGQKRYKVTSLMKKRTNFALNIRKKKK